MNKNILKLAASIILTLIIFPAHSFSQPAKIQTSSEIELALQKLDVLGSVLYIAAHPDDENTALMAYFSKGAKYRTGYLALTRGDGGQNLIGSEKGVEIGILRTQELMQARKIDGGEQFFSRAIDFGYSKSPEETFKIWGKEDVLSDVVWVIRKFKPDVIITRFPVGRSGGHGHHTASALLAEEAFKDAADPNKFPDQLKYVEPWQAKRIFWNNWRPSEEEMKNALSVDIGDYNPLLGESYTEIAAQARSMHKSQGFGVSPSRGERLEYFSIVDGAPAKKNIMDGVNLSWSRIKNGEAIGKKLNSILKSFNPNYPSASIPKLVELLGDMNKIKNNYWVDIKKKELLDVIKSCAGLWMEAAANDYSCAPGDMVSVNALLVNRSNNNFKLVKLDFPTIHSDTLVDAELKNNQVFSLNHKITVPASYSISQPYWLVNQPSKGLFNVTDQQMIGMPENPPSIPVRFIISCDGQELEYTLPLIYHWNDRVEGEEYRPFEVRPPVTMNPVNKVMIFPDNNSKEIQVKIKSHSNSVDGELHFKLQDGWKISPASIPFSLTKKYDEKILSFEITPPANQSETNLKFVASVNGKDYDKSIVEISYPHIDERVYFPESELKLVKLDIKTLGSKIGYVMGSGDEVPDCIRDLGYNVTMFTDAMLQESDLTQYDAIVIGIRAYNTRDRLKYDQVRLLDYVKNGGTVVVQYQIPYGLLIPEIGPYPFKLSQDRITDEDAKLNFVNPSQQLLNFPNKITEKDFDGWIQERGLYFANEWDNKYEPILSGHDPGEKDLEGGMLFTKYGKGVYIYSGYDWFRELPAGVPGAFRIFANMISAGKYNGSAAN